MAHGAEAFQKLLETAAEAWEYKLRLCIERTGLDSVDGREQIVAEMLELFRQSPGFGGSARENIVLNRLAFRVGLSESQIREMLVSGRRKAASGAASAARAKSPSASRAGQDGAGQDGAGQDGAGQDGAGNDGAGHSAAGAEAVGAKTRDGKLERELLEILLSDPMAVDELRAAVAVDDFKHEHHRRLLGICYRLSEEGERPSYEKVMSAAEDPDLKRLVVTLEAAARAKAQKLRLDCAIEVGEGQQSLLAKLIELFKRQADAQEASLGRLAVQSGLSGGGHSGAGPAGMPDAAQMEALRRATEIHGERAGGRAASNERAGGRAKAKTTT
jgi:hypothetical protein